MINVLIQLTRKEAKLIYEMGDEWLDEIVYFHGMNSSHHRAAVALLEQCRAQTRKSK